MRVQLFVRLKKSVLDPQGEAVQRALPTRKASFIKSIRIGKLIEIEVGEDTKKEAVLEEISLLANDFLTNPVIEDYEINVIEEG